MIFSGTSPNGRLVEIAELRDHPFFVASQFHPEFRSRPNLPHPLFRDFVAAVCVRAGIEGALPLAGAVVMPTGDQVQATGVARDAVGGAAGDGD